MRVGNPSRCCPGRSAVGPQRLTGSRGPADTTISLGAGGSQLLPGADSGCSLRVSWYRGARRRYTSPSTTGRAISGTTCSNRPVLTHLRVTDAAPDLPICVAGQGPWAPCRRLFSIEEARLRCPRQSNTESHRSVTPGGDGLLLAALRRVGPRGGRTPTRSW